MTIMEYYHVFSVLISCTRAHVYPQIKFRTLSSWAFKFHDFGKRWVLPNDYVVGSIPMATEHVTRYKHYRILLVCRCLADVRLRLGPYQHHYQIITIAVWV